MERNESLGIEACEREHLWRIENFKIFLANNLYFCIPSKEIPVKVLCLSSLPDCLQRMEDNFDCVEHFQSENTLPVFETLLPVFITVAAWTQEEPNLQTDKETQTEAITGYVCNECKACFSSPEALSRHQRKHPRQKEKLKHKCPYCAYLASCEALLNRHLLTHTGDKPHACKQCGKRFSLESHFRQHLLVHTGEKKHECGTCGKRFAQESNLRTHERVHSRERPYRCSECGKDFSVASNMKRHLRIHTIEKDYPCPNCEQSFIDSSHLTNHIASVHTKEFPHNCSYCQKGFRSPGELKKHIEKKHKEEVPKSS
ncbi:hypothetical protein CEXT_75081 [Caerostris extrusa]|uniref:C2H2-type domain-containing protein n=1 Tax=Caerostris extrusa TaxID=172846 RepID=A0AAV4MZV9_CAEEX|nr:hypothetical protein CEXT_75081 [Caerostris extrusa]